MTYLVWIEDFGAWYCLYEGDKFDPKKPGNYDIFTAVELAYHFTDREQARSIVQYLHEVEDRHAIILVYQGGL